MIDGMLDANIIIDLLRPVPRTVNWYATLRTQQIAIVPIVWLEVVQGAQNKIEQQRTVRFLNRFQIEHPTTADNLWAMQHFGNFYLSHRIQYEDVMIASVAVRLNIPLYTFNDRHFAPLPNVNVQRPY